MKATPIHAVLAMIACMITLVSPIPVWACHDGSPLILDLNGDGVRTVDENHAVSFDLDADGFSETVTWTFWESDEGFLFLDLNRNGRVDDGGELFGDSTLLPTGEKAENGFIALAVYDQPAFGGDGDGILSQGDGVWNELRIWVDGNHDGVSQPVEVQPLARHGIVALGLDASATGRIDGNGNGHYLEGSYVKQSADAGGLDFEELAMNDVYFKIIH